MDQAAEIVRPFPVVGFDPRTNIIIAVNDEYFQPQNNDSETSSNENSSSSSNSLGSSSTAQISQDTSNSSSSLMSGGGQEREDSSDDSGPLDHAPPPPPSAAVRDSELPLGSSTTPFEALFTIEDPCGHTQSASIMFSLRINSHIGGGRIFTTTTLMEFCLSLYSPGDPRQPCSTDPLSLYFFCNEICLWIGPDSLQLDKCIPHSKSPNHRWDIEKMHWSTEHTIGLNSTLTCPPSVQIAVSKKSMGGVDLDPISQYIDFKEARFRKLWPTREHFWKYPLHPNSLKGEDIELITYISKVRYANTDGIESIHARVRTIHVVSSNSRSTNKLRRKCGEQREQRRAESKPFDSRESQNT